MARYSGDRQIETLLLETRINKTIASHEFIPADLEPFDVVRVINDPHGVGVRINYPYPTDAFLQ